MIVILSNKSDAIRHIDQLYPIGNNDQWDKIWLQEIQQFGIENLPEELLKRMAKLMLEKEGATVIVTSTDILMDGKEYD